MSSAIVNSTESTFRLTAKVARSLVNDAVRARSPAGVGSPLFHRELLQYGIGAVRETNPLCSWQISEAILV